MEILKVENLSKTYGSGDNVVKALDNVSFSIEKGQFVAIIGPSGSGKSDAHPAARCPPSASAAPALSYTLPPPVSLYRQYSRSQAASSW